MADVNLATFPKNALESLAMFYVQQVLFPKMTAEEATPEALLGAYYETLQKLKDEYKRIGPQIKTGKRWF